LYCCLIYKIKITEKRFGCPELCVGCPELSELLTEKRFGCPELCGTLWMSGTLELSELLLA
jgi:hypothetical protein